MGHQLMMFIVSKDIYLLKSTDSYYTQDSLKFSFTNKTDTKLFANFSDDLLQAAQYMNITANFHNWGLHTKDFLSSQQPYSKFYRLLSTSIDKKGVSYVSSTEAIKYPFFTSQFHPEVTLYGFMYNFTDHSDVARAFAYELSLKFVGEARKNNQKFESYTELQKLLVQSTGVNKMGYSDKGKFYDNFYFYISTEAYSISE